MSYRAIKYRIYPTEMQIILLTQFFGCVRKVYNELLALQNERYEAGEKHLSKTAMNNYCNNVLKDKYPYLRLPDKFALTNSIYALADAFTNFFEKRAGYPNFKTKHHSRDSYTTNFTNNNIAVVKGGVKLPKLGIVSAKIHRFAPENWVLKSATVSKTPSGEYYVSVLYEYDNQVNEVTPVYFLGLDYSSPYLYIDSEGNEPDYEKQFRKYEEKLAKEQRKLTRKLEANIAGYKTVGGKSYPVWKKPLSECKNYQKQKLVIAKLHAKIANCRKNALHEISCELADLYDVIVVEDLNMQAMAQGLNLSKATMDNGYGMFVRFLEYKLKDRGKKLIKVDKWYPSTKTCSCCGNVKPVRLDERTYMCPECGMVMDRDVNAAINIRNEAIRLLSI